MKSISPRCPHLSDQSDGEDPASPGEYVLANAILPMSDDDEAIDLPRVNSDIFTNCESDECRTDLTKFENISEIDSIHGIHRFTLPGRAVF
jgi:hypothetical protein